MMLRQDRNYFGGWCKRKYYVQPKRNLSHISQNKLTIKKMAHCRFLQVPYPKQFLNFKKPVKTFVIISR